MFLMFLTISSNLKCQRYSDFIYHSKNQLQDANYKMHLSFEMLKYEKRFEIKEI